MRWQGVTATVETTGLDPECPYVASSSQAICDPPPPVRLFLEYASISSTKEKSLLDKFVNQLRNEPGAQGYILVCGRSHRAEGAKNYLIGHDGLDAGRIVIVEKTSRARKVRIKLYIVPTGALPPETHSAPPNKRLQRTGISVPPIDNLSHDVVVARPL